MRGVLSWLAAIGGSLLFAAGAVASYPLVRGGSAAVAGERRPNEAAPGGDRETQALLQRLSELSELVSRNAQSPQMWRYQQAQADVMLQIAVRSKGKDRDDWLRMAVDSYYSAAVQAPENEPGAYQRLVELSAQIGRTFPGSPVSTCAAVQEIQAEHLRMLTKGDTDPDKARERLRDRLMRFAQDHPEAPEAPKAVMEAGQLSEALGKKDDAGMCYRYLAQRYAGTPAGRKAGGNLWRLGASNEPVQLPLPLLYPADEHAERPFDLAELRGKVVVVYFWSSAAARAAADFVALKQLTDRYQYRGLEIVYVCLDDDAAKARAFLTGKLTAGTHLFQKGGLDSPIAERYGVGALPQALLIGRDGNLLRHSVPVPNIEQEVAGQLSRAPVRR
jgi:hypothetical protein